MTNNYYIKNIFSKFIEIEGDDSINFLQDLITNDINKCNKDRSIYACLLTPQGKFLADFFISKIDNIYLIEINKKYYDSFISKLKMYKLRSKVNIKENNEIQSIILFSENKLYEINSIISFRDPRHKKIGHIIYLDKDCLESLSIKEYNYDFYREILIRHLIPHTPDDLIENKSLLLENNFQNMNAIDWNKGCYVGQEITARMKYRSLLKKQIYVLEIISGDIKPGDNIIEKEINIGNVISKVDKYVLCMLKIHFVKNKKNEIKINSNIILKFL